MALKETRIPVASRGRARTPQSTDRIARTVINVAICRILLRSILLLITDR